jgi:hypothetical protein
LGCDPLPELASLRDRDQRAHSQSGCSTKTDTIRYGGELRI